MAEARLYLPRAAAEGRRVACPDALGALVAEVAEIVGDPAVGEQEILRALGRGLLAAAATARLPDLAAEARLPFGPGQEHAALPADLQHGPVDAFLLPGRGRIRILPDPAALRRAARRPGRGPARLAAAGGGRLHVWPVPQAAVEVAVSYFRLPDPLAGWADKPACLPPHLAGRLLVSFACREVFERLEEGADGKKPQTTAYGARWQAALDELVGLCGPATFQDAAVDVPLCAGEDWS